MPSEREVDAAAIRRARKYGADPDFSLMPRLFPPELRPHVRAFGSFVRLADAITDDVLLSRPAKLAQLDALAAALAGRPAEGELPPEAAAVAVALADSLRRTGVSPEHALCILRAYREDAAGRVRETWQDLMAYCRLAAAPIGRHMLSLAGEDLALAGPQADALCAALRILKQLRDCTDPTIQFNRLCIPQRFLADAMIDPRHLRAASARGQTRAVLDRVLDGVDRLLDSARPLPGLLHRRGLVVHTAIVLCRGRRLSARFRRRDPLAQPVGLSRWQRLLCRWLGTLRGIGRA